MDTSWIDQPRNSDAYIQGVCAFIEFAKKGAQNGKVRCPCKFCRVDQRKILSLEEVERHILFKGLYKEYRDWIFHGPRTLAENVARQVGQTSEIRQPLEFVGQDDINGLLRDTIGFNMPFTNDFIGDNRDHIENERVEIEEFAADCVIDDQIPNEQPPLFSPDEEAKYLKLIDAANEPLYPGCTGFSVLSFTLRLFHLKCMFNWPHKSFSLLIELLLDAFPQISNFPSSYYQAKKMIMDLGHGYENIHACPNNCTLYWGENADKDYCPSCNTSRWKSGECKKKTPRKVMKYFPLVPRLKRMYMSSKIAEDMRWHDMRRNKDKFLRHPADGKSWKDFDSRFSDFSSDPRSVRLGHATDGFNPYRLMSTTYSIWPVVLIPYNLPPWQCMKPSSFILSMIIPGKEGPGNNIDVYLQPLIRELNLLWEGVPAFDSYRNETFNMRAALVWTINDFPAYGIMSGWSTKGYKACPICAAHTPSVRIGNKICYMGHRKWLPIYHHFRYQSNLFDGSVEHDTTPAHVSGSDVLREQEQIIHFNSVTHKTCKKRKRPRGGNTVVDEVEVLWTKKSIFFDLPYWKFNLLRHNLDFMHIENNVAEYIVSTLMDIEGKSRDDEAAREFLRERNVKPHLWLHYSNEGELFMPPPSYCMLPEDKASFLRVLANLKTPDGYGSNLSRCVNLKKKKLMNLKSHDNHILMQDILQVALRASRASQEVVDLIDDLCSWFKSLCSKEINVDHLDDLQSNIVDILCRMEIEFLPPFFTIMVHLLIHLVDEVMLGGPVHYRWMYPIERFLSHLKTYVRNKAQPEGSIAEGYVLEETITFCSRYLEGVETIFNRPHRNDVDNVSIDSYLLDSRGRPIGRQTIVRVPNRNMAQIHRYVLTQFEELIKPFIEEFICQKCQEDCNRFINEVMISKWKIEEFPKWFRSQANKIDENNPEGRLLKALACGPTPFAKRVKGYIINGVKFCTTTRETIMKTQNSGVMVIADGRKYYGKLTDILEIDYHGTYRVVVFRCDWVNINSAVDDTNRRPRVNFSRLIHTGRFLNDEPFVIASQAKQVFYVPDLVEKGWHYVVETKPRDVYDLGSDQCL